MPPQELGQQPRQLDHVVGARDGAARCGTLHTAHGPIATPAFIPLATKATVRGSARFEGRQLIGAEPRDLRAIRGKRIGYNGTFADGTPAKIAFDALVAVDGLHRLLRAHEDARLLDLTSQHFAANLVELRVHQRRTRVHDVDRQPAVLQSAGGLESPVFLDCNFLLGPEAAHLNITGVSGLATKTSAVEWLLASLFQHFPASKGSIAAVAFNVKGPDLCFLDQPGEIGAQLARPAPWVYAEEDVAPDAALPFQSDRPFAAALFGSRLRIIPLDTGSNHGIAFVTLVEE